MRNTGRRNIWKGLTAGMAGGLVASYAMNEFQTIWNNASKKQEQRKNPGKKQDEGQQEDATMKAAEAISESFTGRQLSYEEKKKASPFVHYGFGTLMGGLYGAAAEFAPFVKKGLGVPYGTAVFAGADELGVYALGLGPSPLQTPASTHGYALASHWVYGLTAELVRRGMRRVL